MRVLILLSTCFGVAVALEFKKTPAGQEIVRAGATVLAHYVR